MCNVTGVSCFANAAAQFLIHLVPLQRILLSSVECACCLLLFVNCIKKTHPMFHTIQAQTPGGASCVPWLHSAVTSSRVAIRFTRSSSCIC